MSRARLAYGESGEVHYTPMDGGRVQAMVYFRDHTGRRRRKKASGRSKADARRRVQRLVADALSAGGGDFTARTRFEVAAERWMRTMDELVERGRRSPTTADLYRRVLRVHVAPGLGHLRLAELTTARVDEFLQDRLRRDSYAVAKLCRTVVSGICGWLVRQNALRSNPVRDTTPLEGSADRMARALTPSELHRWLAILDGDDYAIRKDLPDLVRFLLATGVRLGEALGVTWADINLDSGLVSIERTVVRIAGQGLVAKPPKSRTSYRVLPLPRWAVDLLTERRQRTTGLGPVFPDARGGYRDRNNVERDFRLVRAGTAFEWVVPHTYRKTVATLLDADGLSARFIADQLGHSRVSMTQDFYLGRRAVDATVATSLEQLDLFESVNPCVPECVPGVRATEKAASEDTA